MAKKTSAKDAVYAQLGKDSSVQIGLGSGAPYLVNTGHYVLNWALSGLYHGGWAGGGVNELFGDPSTGKSLIINQAMASFQRGDILVVQDDRVDMTDRFVLLDDTEGAYQKAFCQLLGLDVEDVIKLVDTKTVEGHFKQMEAKVDLIRTHTKKAPIGVFCDSVSQLSTEGEMKNGMDKEDMKKAKKLHQAMRIYSTYIERNSLFYLLSSHVIDNMSMFGPKKRVKGGAGLAFQANCRLELTYKKLFVRNVMETRDLGKKGEVYGVRGFAQVVKNRIAPPFRFALLDVYYDRGLDPYSGLLDHFIRSGRAVGKKFEKIKKDDDKAKIEEKKKLWVGLVDGEKVREDELVALVIDKDLLGIKKAGRDYMKPLASVDGVSLEEYDSDADSADGADVEIDADVEEVSGRKKSGKKAPPMPPPPAKREPVI